MEAQKPCRTQNSFLNIKPYVPLARARLEHDVNRVFSTIAAAPYYTVEHPPARRTILMGVVGLGALTIGLIAFLHPSLLHLTQAQATYAVVASLVVAGGSAAWFINKAISSYGQVKPTAENETQDGDYWKGVGTLAKMRIGSAAFAGLVGGAVLLVGVYSFLQPGGVNQLAQLMQISPRALEIGATGVGATLIGLSYALYPSMKEPKEQS